MQIKTLTMRFVHTGLSILIAVLGCVAVDSVVHAQETDSDSKSEPKSSQGGGLDSGSKQDETKQDDKDDDLKFLVTSDTLLWEDYQPTDAMAEFKMPGKPRLVERMIKPMIDQPQVKVRRYSVAFNEGTGLFMFSYCDLPVEPTEELINDTLTLAMEGSLFSVGGQKLSEGKIRYRTHPGQTFGFRYAHEGKIYQGSSRVFLVGQRQYQVTAIMLEEKFDKETADAFLNSFRLIEPKEEKPKEESVESKEESVEPKEESAEPKKEENGG